VIDGAPHTCQPPVTTRPSLNVIRLLLGSVPRAGIIRAGANGPPHGAEMDLAELTQRMHDFVRAKGWYDAGTPRPQTPRNIATSLCIEAAEILEHFQWRDEVADGEALAGELADVALYLLQLAAVADIDLEAAILDKLKSNYGRSWDGDRAGR
jgi:NTP pyrophosphatase (non-canonical NTP hydrolase)